MLRLIILRCLVVGLVGWMLAGCSTTSVSESEFAPLQVGMSEAEVRSVWGLPSRIKKLDIGVERRVAWDYYRHWTVFGGGQMREATGASYDRPASKPDRVRTRSVTYTGAWVVLEEGAVTEWEITRLPPSWAVSD